MNQQQQHVLAEWIPLHGRLARKPTAVSWRRQRDRDLYQLVVLVAGVIDVLHAQDPEQASREWAAIPEVTHWLEGHPEDRGE